MKYLLIAFLSIVIFSCSNNNKEPNNNADKATINLDDSTDNNINKTEQSNNSSINTNETEETEYYSYTDEEI
ncbi:ankyrin, partial [Brachyspira hyodysenteriae]